MTDSTPAAEFAYAICATLTHWSYRHKETIKEQPSPIRIIWTVTYLTARIVCELLIRCSCHFPWNQSVMFKVAYGSARSNTRIWQSGLRWMMMMMIPKARVAESSWHILTPFGLDSDHPYLVPLGKAVFGLNLWKKTSWSLLEPGAHHLAARLLQRRPWADCIGDMLATNCPRQGEGSQRFGGADRGTCDDMSRLIRWINKK